MHANELLFNTCWETSVFFCPLFVGSTANKTHGEITSDRKVTEKNRTLIPQQGVQVYILYNETNLESVKL